MDILDPTAPFGVQRTVQDQKMEITMQYVTQDPSNVYLAVKLVIMDQTVHRYAVVRLKPATAAISKTVRGICTNGCNPSYYCEPTCQASCSDACLQTTCYQNCTCSLGCQTNKWGEQCEKGCSANCGKPSDTKINVCDRKDGTCSHGCTDNTLWGGQCSSLCPENCLNGTCERWSGNCTAGCTNNKVYGIGCDQKCPSNCINKSCRRQDGFCKEGCISGWYGSQCDHECGVYCVNSSCDRLEGRCSCETGRFGTKCEFLCPETCLNKECHPVSGICTHGGISGYDREKFDIISSLAKPCQKTPTNCIDNTCDSDRDVCLLGCNDGFMGEYCDKVISNSPISMAEIGIAIGEGVLFLMLVTVIIYLAKKSDRCKGLRMKFSRRSEKVIRGTREPNPYTELNRSTDAEVTANPYDALYMNTTASVFIAAYNCSENCAVPESNDTDTCDILTGACSFRCKQGFAGDNCSFVCPDQCGNPNSFNTETCNDSTGACLHGCQYGYTGPDCSIQCPENCMGPSDSNNSAVCDETSRECLFGCKQGYYGSNCTQQCGYKIYHCDSCYQENSTSDLICTECGCCSMYLKNNVCKDCSYWCQHRYPYDKLCNKDDSTCTHGCKTGRYGPFCEKNCPSTCKESVCEFYSGSCLNGCSLSRFCGTTCQASCSDACLQRSCYQNCTCSLGCYNNNWGERCDKDCSTNCLKPSDAKINVCDRKDGTCRHGCVNNTMWDSQCSTVCSQDCLIGTCERWSGNCINGCTNNKVYGIQCDQECSTNCRNSSCRRQDGYCEAGCISGWYGSQCAHKCSAHCVNNTCDRLEGTCSCKTGRFGTKCEFSCQESCVNNVCHLLSGICTYGCIRGYDGEKCDKESSLANTCHKNVTNCIDNMCDSDNVCLRGCKDGFVGAHCDKGVPVSPMSWTENGIAIGEAVLFLMLVTIIIYLVRKSNGCKGIRDKLSRRSDIKETVLRPSRDDNPYTELCRTNDAEVTAEPYDSLVMNTTTNNEVHVPSSNPAHKVTKTNSSYELMNV